MPSQNSEFHAEEASGPLRGRSLVLEDNAIIGLEAEAQLLDLGAGAVDVATTIAQAMELLANHAYEFALLDVNVGAENCRPVADALGRAGVPHAFSTGYGAVPWAEAGGQAMPLLIKPFDAPALVQAVAAARRALASR